MALAAPQSLDERLSHRAFEALMWAIAAPGSVQRLPEPGFKAIADSLVDLEVTVFTLDGDLSRHLGRTGATTMSATTMGNTTTGAERAGLGAADYLFIPKGAVSSMGDLAAMRVGDPLYPDRAATLIIGADIGRGARLRLSGPGIDGSREIALGGLPPLFWETRAQACRYPLGWDAFYVDGDQVAATPRSTVVEALR